MLAPASRARQGHALRVPSAVLTGAVARARAERVGSGGNVALVSPRGIDLIAVNAANSSCLLLAARAAYQPLRKIPAKTIMRGHPRHRGGIVCHSDM